MTWLFDKVFLKEIIGFTIRAHVQNARRNLIEQSDRKISYLFYKNIIYKKNVKEINVCKT